MNLNATQWTGVVSFGIGACASALAARRDLRPWVTLAAVQAACTVEVVIGLRHRLHDRADQLMRLHGWYEARSNWQIAALAAGALLVGAIVVAFAGWRPPSRSAGCTTAHVATLGIVTLFGIETVSLHATDAWLYAPAGPVLRIAWVWVLLTGCVVIGAVRA